MRQIEAFSDRLAAALVAQFGFQATKHCLNILSALITATMIFSLALEARNWYYFHDSRSFWSTAFTFSIPSLFGMLLKATDDKNERSAKNMHTPRLPMRYIFCFLLPKKVREPLLGDVEEEYQEIRVEYGERTAKLWYYKQLVALIWPTLQMSGRTLAKWGIVGWLEEMIRRIAH